MIQENPNSSPQTQYNIKEKKITRIWLELLWVVNHILRFFSLRKTRQFWGVVYDSVSKQPLDPVIVKLLYSDGREIETCVTDLAGSYGFLAQPGKFKIFVRKTHYLFPSKYVTGDTDGIFENLYHGEFFQLFDDEEVVAPNIPMDPEKFDWNQEAKQKVIKVHAYGKLFVKKLFFVIFWFVLIFSLLSAWRFYPNKPIWIIIVIAVCLILLISRMLFPEERLWGQMQFVDSALAEEKLLLELNKPQFSSITFGKTVIRADGKFLLRAAPGNYNLNVTKQLDSGEKQFLGSVPVKVGRLNVLNGSFFINN